MKFEPPSIRERGQVAEGVPSEPAWNAAQDALTKKKEPGTP